MQRQDTWSDFLWGSLAIGAVVALFLGYAVPAGAADKGGGLSKIVDSVVAPASWTGCGVGVGGSILNGDASGGGPFTIGSNGQALGGRLLCDVQLGGFVIGANVDYDKVFGDLHTIGVDTSWAVGGRAGPLINSATLLFVSGGWTQVDTKAGNMGGWYMGGGIETKLPNSPLFLTLEYQHRIYDATDLGAPAGIDVAADVIRVGAALKFNLGK